MTYKFIAKSNTHWGGNDLHFQDRGALEPHANRESIPNGCYDTKVIPMTEVFRSSVGDIISISIPVDDNDSKFGLHKLDVMPSGNTQFRFIYGIITVNLDDKTPIKDIILNNITLLTQNFIGKRKGFGRCGFPTRELMDPWINGTCDIRSGVFHYNDIIETGLAYSEQNHIVTDKINVDKLVINEDDTISYLVYKDIYTPFNTILPPKKGIFGFLKKYIFPNKETYI